MVSGPSRDAATWSASSAPFAPSATAIWLRPSRSVQMEAQPVAWPGSTRSAVSPTPAACSPASAAAASASSPTAPIICTAAPSRAAATAWLAPLPPGCTVSRSAISVWPGIGMRSSRKIRSALMDPNTTIIAAPSDS